MPADQTRIAVCADPPHEVALQQRADELAEVLSIPKTKLGQPECDLLLAVMRERLELRVLSGPGDLVGGRGVFSDLAAIDTTSPAGRKLDTPLIRAVGIKKGRSDRPRVIDATAGLGEDAWLLAAIGCEVTAVERQPIIAALLDDALTRAATTNSDAAARITLRHTSTIHWLTQAARPEPPAPLADAIVIDPMFPLGRKAKERKPMRVLRLLAGNDDDAPMLLDAALRTGVHRVCVKRPLRAPAIEHAGGRAPDVAYKGKAVRFDVYLNH